MENFLSFCNELQNINDKNILQNYQNMVIEVEFKNFMSKQY